MAEVDFVEEKPTKKTYQTKCFHCKEKRTGANRTWNTNYIGI